MGAEDVPTHLHDVSVREKDAGSARVAAYRQDALLLLFPLLLKLGLLLALLLNKVFELLGVEAETGEKRMCLVLIGAELNLLLVLEILQLLLAELSLLAGEALLLLLLLDVKGLGLAPALLLDLLSCCGLLSLSRRVRDVILLLFLEVAAFIVTLVRLHRVAVFVQQWLGLHERALGTLNVYLCIDLLKAQNRLAGASSTVVAGLEEAITGGLNMREADGARILLGSATTSPRVDIDQRLPIGTLGVLVLHVCVQRRIGQVGLVAVVAPVVPALDVVLGTPLLLLLVVIAVIVPRVGVLPTAVIIIILRG